MQTSYSQDPVAGLPGQLSSSYPHALETRAAQGVVTTGLYVISGTAELSAVHPTGAFDPEDALGIVHRDAHNVQPQGATANNYADKQSLAVIRQGKVWVAHEMVTDGDAVPGKDSLVYVRTTAATGLPAGSLRATAGVVQQTLAVTVVTTDNTAEFVLEVELADGSEVDLGWTSGSSQTAAQKATAYAAFVDDIDGFTAAAVGAIVTITHEDGVISAVAGHSAAGIFTLAESTAEGSAIATLVPGAYFRQTAGGVSEVELGTVSEV